MKSSIQILGTRTGDTTPSVLVTFDSQRYLFNAGEGTQRFCIEKRVRLGKLNNIFLTKVQWDACGGIPGMLLSLDDAGNNNIQLHGGSNLAHFMAATRHFVFKMSAHVKVNEFDEGTKPFSDENLTVLPVLIRPVQSANCRYKDPTSSFKKLASEAKDGSPKSVDAPGSVVSSNSETLLDQAVGTKRKAVDDGSDLRASVMRKSDQSVQHCRQIIQQMFNSGESVSINVGRNKAHGATRGNVPSSIQEGKKDHTKLVRLPETSPSDTVISYICKGPAVRGKFDVATAQSLGVAPGKQFCQLLDDFESVTTNSQGDVHPHQVVGPEKAGCVFIIVECPSSEYIPSLVNSDQFVPHYAEHTSNPVATIVHMLGDDVLEVANYQTWMKRFGQTTQHIIISRKHCAKPIVFCGSATSQHRLSLLDPDVFRVPYYSNTPATLPTALPTNTAVAFPLMVYNMEPLRGFEDGEPQNLWDHLDPNGKVLRKLEHPSMVSYQEAATGIQNEIRSTITEEEQLNSAGSEVMLCTLGTAAALPSRYRNVSSTLVDVPNVGTILLDAGEGTFGQLFRRFYSPPDGPALKDILRNLRLLFISHMHADHHVGAIRILKERYKLLSGTPVLQPLYIVGPPHYHVWLREYADCEDLGLDGIIFIPCHDFEQSGTLHRRLDTDRLLKDLCLKSLQTVQVHHAPYAYGVSIVLASGFKLVYSGDCRPDLHLLEVGGEADVLIHEATFEDDPCGFQEAQSRRHSTTSEAVIVGGRMNAKWIILTHFSQRVPKLPKLNLDPFPSDIRARMQKCVGVAFDLMSLKVGQLRRMAMYFPALEKLYPARLEDSPDLDQEDLQQQDDLSGASDNRQHKQGSTPHRGRGRGRPQGRYDQR
ncbi:hypothetical protein HDU85_007267 [Gaertneriomyces sp. JEL0708]|nr:hypothetical protein HDU85_007267 [Gaertneriomyces sp. JEL0708]